MTFGDRLSAVFADHGGLCLGIDPHAALLADWGLPDSAAGAREFGLRAIDGAVGAIGIVKPQIAFYERHGSAGFAALEDVIRTARAAGLIVIADVKRGDMGSTFDAYAESWLLPGSPFEADAMTAVAFQGTGVLDRAFQLGLEHGKGVFVLCATSNPGSASVQAAKRGDGRTVAAGILDDMELRNVAAGGPLGPFGVVIGATNRVEEFGLDLSTAGRTPILGPGFGAQGARLADAHATYGSAAARVIANVSRDALAAGADGLTRRIRVLTEELARGVAA